MSVRLPNRTEQNIVAGFRLRFGFAGKYKLVALARDVVDLNLDFFLLSLPAA